MKGRDVGLSTLMGGAVLIGGQIAYVSLRRLPLADGFDPSGVFGDPGAPRLRIAVLGDSSITGQGLETADDCWARVLARYFAGRFRVELDSYAVGGARAWQVLEQQVPLAERTEYDIVIVSVGSNDILRMTPPWRLERNLDAIVARLQRVSAAVVLFGIGDLGSIPRIPWPVDLVAGGSGHVADWVHRRVAKRRGAAKVDQWALTTAAFNSGTHMFSADLFHPSARGHRAWADAVIPTVESELARLAADNRAATVSWDVPEPAGVRVVKSASG